VTRPCECMHLMLLKCERVGLFCGDSHSPFGAAGNFLAQNYVAVQSTPHSLAGMLVFYKSVTRQLSANLPCERSPDAVAARKDDAPAAVQAAIVNVAGLNSSSPGGGLIQTTSG